MSVADVIGARSERYLGWLHAACSIPSLDGRPDDLARMATWVADRLGDLDASIQRLALDEAPDALLGSLGTGQRSVLIYDHYDVQPVDPIELWHSDPFAPDTRDGKFYARGAADNKGDLVARLAALEVYEEVHGSLPCVVKFLIEGEEETGSASFETLIDRYGDLLSADGCIWEGEGIDHIGRPKFVFGAKGLAYVELHCTTLNEDQHSMMAVVAPSPVWRLIEALSTLRAPDGRVLIDGFYDDVVEPSDADTKMLAELDLDEEAERQRLGTKAFVGGVTGADFKKRYFFEPTCNIAGIDAGFTVPGAQKTVLPKEAMAKIDMRLVPDQDPHDVVKKLRAHLDARGFEDIEVRSFSMEHPVRSPSDSSIGRAAIGGAHVFDRKPVVAPLMIGTGPMYPIAGRLGIPTVSPAGVCRPDSNIHAPNEHVLVDDFLKVIEYTVAWLRAFADD